MAKLFAMENEGVDEIVEQPAVELMSDVEIKYLNNLDLEPVDEVALEGVIRHLGGGVIDAFSGMSTEIKGWFQGIESKRLHTLAECDELLAYIKDAEVEYRDLDFDTGTIKQLLFKSGNMYAWRFKFLLDDQAYNKIMKDIKDNKASDLEDLVELDMLNNIKMSKDVQRVTSLADFRKIVETYKERTDKFYKAILARKTTIKGAPFQVILLGIVDLKTLIKGAIRLAK